MPAQVISKNAKTLPRDYKRYSLLFLCAYHCTLLTHIFNVNYSHVFASQTERHNFSPKLQGHFIKRLFLQSFIYWKRPDNMKKIIEIIKIIEVTWIELNWSERYLKRFKNIVVIEIKTKAWMMLNKTKMINFKLN